MVFRLASGATGAYRIVCRFDSSAHLRGWLDSDEHAAWMERAEPHVADPMRTGTEFLTGLESWFTLPTQPGAPPPPPYKMAGVTWVTIFSVITLVIMVSSPLIGSLPLVPRLAQPAAAHYITLVERGYALRELVFAILFLVIVAIPLRARQRWAWWACWTVLIAYLGYTFTFGIHDSAILARSLVGVIALPILLLVQMPIFTRRANRNPS